MYLFYIMNPRKYGKIQNLHWSHLDNQELGTKILLICTTSISTLTRNWDLLTRKMLYPRFLYGHGLFTILGTRRHFINYSTFIFKFVIALYDIGPITQLGEKSPSRLIPDWNYYLDLFFVSRGPYRGKDFYALIFGSFYTWMFYSTMRHLMV